ncbi:uncharacterized protein LOC125198532 isoform X2 [Salvia hispanica]|nr:uncharacterized protein LOC125197429 isoform X2 [Salvia hispanica]XP_047952123.1 uncharacterized protein LOC125197429 isoform X2 [Salvia hispanica]XP_047952797.1 uncharacterized protein LOC125198532 isoform X2 [Salvia hispanica]XP_047952798.1 uncharacterized protein LOC125198532 isoform X2 [Salvia hispanica]
MAHADNSKSNNSEQRPYLQLDPPKFNGDDPWGWTFKVDMYFDYYGMSEEHRLHFVGLLFEQPALDWLIYRKKHNLLKSWPSFMEAVKERFDPTYHDNHFGILCKLQQLNMVMEYQDEFERLLVKIKGASLSESHLVSICESGFKDAIRWDLHLRKPSSLCEMFALAREFEKMYDEGFK